MIIFTKGMPLIPGYLKHLEFWKMTTEALGLNIFASFYSTQDGVLVDHRIVSSIKFASSCLYAWFERHYGGSFSPKDT